MSNKNFGRRRLGACMLLSMKLKLMWDSKPMYIRVDRNPARFIMEILNVSRGVPEIDFWFFVDFVIQKKI